LLAGNRISSSCFCGKIYRKLRVYPISYCVLCQYVFGRLVSYVIISINYCTLANYALSKFLNACSVGLQILSQKSQNNLVHFPAQLFVLYYFWTSSLPCTFSFCPGKENEIKSHLGITKFILSHNVFVYCNCHGILSCNKLISIFQTLSLSTIGGISSYNLGGGLQNHSHLLNSYIHSGLTVECWRLLIHYYAF